MVNQVRMGCQDKRGVRVPKENKAYQGCQGAQGCLELVSQDFLDQKATKVMGVYLVLRDQRVTKVMAARLG